MRRKAVHLKEIGGGKTYSQLSAEAQAQPSNPKLAAQVETVFKGTTSRGLLLNAFATRRSAASPVSLPSPALRVGCFVGPWFLAPTRHAPQRRGPARPRSTHPSVPEVVGRNPTRI
jgi:hypothetical protein